MAYTASLSSEMTEDPSVYACAGDLIHVVLRLVKGLGNETRLFAVYTREQLVGKKTGIIKSRYISSVRCK